MSFEHMAGAGHGGPPNLPVVLVTPSSRPRGPSRGPRDVLVTPPRPSRPPTRPRRRAAARGDAPFGAEPEGLRELGGTSSWMTPTAGWHELLDGANSWLARAVTHTSSWASGRASPHAQLRRRRRRRSAWEAAPDCGGRGPRRARGAEGALSRKGLKKTGIGGVRSAAARRGRAPS